MLHISIKKSNLSSKLISRSKKTHLWTSQLNFSKELFRHTTTRKQLLTGLTSAETVCKLFIMTASNQPSRLTYRYFDHLKPSVPDRKHRLPNFDVINLVQKDSEREREACRQARSHKDREYSSWQSLVSCIEAGDFIVCCIWFLAHLSL